MKTSDIILFRGNDAKFRITLQKKDGSAFNLTGTTLDFYVKRNVKEANADAIIHKSTGSGITAGDATGIVTLTIDDTDTTGLEIGKNFIYDIELTTNILAEKFTILRAIFRLRHD